MQQLNYAIKRLLQMIPVLLCVTILVFVMMRLIPGNPAQIMLGEKATPEMVAAKEVEMGLDKPYIVQYGIFLRDLVTGNLGESIQYSIPVSDLLGSRMIVTVSLALMTALFVVLISFPLGYYCGRHKNGIGDNIIRVLSLVALSMPQFWIGILLLLLFGLQLGWVPISGWGVTFLDHVRCLILPSITGALGVCTLMIKNLRGNVANVMGMDFVDFARSKGISEGRVRSRHIVKNALISTVTLLALRIVNLLGYTVVIETAFGLPGVGALLVEAIFRRDYAVVQSVVVIFAALVLIVNLITDISYSLLDPRVELE
ncbi:ABC transporter permease [Zongyangia sp. HA2173]|uniref:ABC transporter permease n=1 Tax=Zongyangia sp. HA2173 TaxID=3133035 RepID=UPI003166C5AF